MLCACERMIDSWVHCPYAREYIFRLIIVGISRLSPPQSFSKPNAIKSITVRSRRCMNERNVMQWNASFCSNEMKMSTSPNEMIFFATLKRFASNNNKKNENQNEMNQHFLCLRLPDILARCNPSAKNQFMNTQKSTISMNQVECRSEMENTLPSNFESTIVSRKKKHTTNTNIWLL